MGENLLISAIMVEVQFKYPYVVILIVLYQFSGKLILNYQTSSNIAEMMSILKPKNWRKYSKYSEIVTSLVVNLCISSLSRTRLF